MAQSLPSSLPRPFSFRKMLSEVSGREPAPAVDFDPPVVVPLEKPMAEAKVGLFVSCGVYHRDHQTPFQVTNDLTYRLIPRDLPLDELELAHRSAVRHFALQDLNVAYPRDRLLELEREGVVGAFADNAVSMVGAVSTHEQLMQQSVPAIVDEYAKQDVDLVLLLPFCPACHTTVPLIARAIEKCGIPTVMTSCLWERVHEYKAPRTAFLDFPMGCPAGKPQDPEMQRAVLRAALDDAAKFEDAWGVEELPFQWSPDGSREWEEEVRNLYVADSKAVAERVGTLAAKRESLAGQEREFAIRCAC